MKVSICNQITSDVCLSSYYKNELLTSLFNSVMHTIDFKDSQNKNLLLCKKEYKNHAINLSKILNAVDNHYIKEIVPFNISRTSVSTNLRHNLVEVNSYNAIRYNIKHNQIIKIFDPNSFDIIECTICINDKFSDDEIGLSTYLKTKFINVEKVFLLITELLITNHVLSQDVISLRDNVITFDSETYEKLSRVNPKYIEIRHLGTGATLTKSFNAVKCSKKIKEHSIKLNYYQRQILNVPLENQVYEEDYKKIEDKIQRTNSSQNYIDKSTNKLTPEYYELQIVPIIDRYKNTNKLHHSISDFYVGKCELSLSAVRPYKIDDSRDIVRLSKDNMSLLGIEETDKVIIEYHGKAIRATAMAIDSLDIMCETNIIFSEADLDVIVGLPTPMRRYLGIGDIETEVIVKRDTTFLLMKNINIQFLPIVALFLTVYQMGEGKLLLKSIICLLATPIIMYLMLSQERSKVKKNDRFKL